MRLSPFWARFMGSTALLFGLLAMFFSAQPAATQAGDSSIEVHNRVCPTDYEGDDWFNDCHDNVPDPGLSFTFTNEDTGETYEGTTNENGNVGFANLSAGTYTITGGAPGEFTDYAVYCSIGPEGATDREPVDVQYVTGGVQFELAANTNVICDWYTVPLSQDGAPTATTPAGGDSSIEVHERVCPQEFDGTDYFGVCHDNPVEAGMPFTFTNEDTGETYEGTTNENGNVGFANLSAGTYTITGGAPGEFADRVVYCSSGVGETNDLSPIDVQQVQGGVQFALPANTNVVCDWYEVPFDLQGDPTVVAPNQFDLPIFTLLCESEPDDTAASDFVMMGTVPEGCEQYAGASVTVTTQDGSTYGTCTTNAAEPCFVTVAVGTTVLATIDPATLPADYAVTDQQTHEVEIPPASEAWVLFVATPAVQTPEPTPTETPLPEGRTVAIHEGTCEPGEPGATVVELTDLRGPELGPDEDLDVIVAETSATTIDMTLDELMQDPHALIAYTDDAAETPVVCTVLDGETNADGELVLGLPEVNDSGFAGIVYAAPTDDGNQTRISVFLAEGLAEDEEAESDATPTPIG